MNEAGSVLVKFEADTARFRADLDKIKASMGGVEAQTEKTATIMSQFRGVLAGFAGIQVARSIGQTALELDNLSKGFRFATGSAEKAAEELDYVKRVSEELGVEFISTAQQYAGLAAASRGTALEGQKARDVFYGITAAASAMGKSSADTAGILNAVQQMMSKGTVSAEELRGQMGERLWGAFQRAAQAIGLTTQELGKQLELGNVMAEDLLPRLSDEMLRLAKEAGTGQGAQAALNRLNNAWTNFQSSLLDASAMEAAIKLIDGLRAGLDTLKQLIGPLIGLFGELYSTIASATGLDKAGEWLRWLGDQLVILGVGVDAVTEKIRRMRAEFNADAMAIAAASVQVRLPKGLFGKSDGMPRVPMSLDTDEIATGEKPRASAAPRRDVLGLLGKGAPSGGSTASRARKEAENIKATFDKLMADSRQTAIETLSDVTDAQLKLAQASLDLMFEPMNDRIKGMEEAWKSVKAGAIDALDAIIVQGQNAGEVIGSLLKMLASEVFKAALSGETTGVGGGIISAVSDFFGGMLGRAGGGPVNRGQPYMVGENGPELFVPSASGRIMRNGSGGGGQSVVVNQSFVFEGVNAATVTMLRNEAGRIADQVRREVAPIMVNAQRRNQLAGAF